MAENKTKSKGMAIASMVCGICGLVFCWWPFVSWLAFIAAVLGIIFGAIALSKIKKGEADGKGMAIAGIVCGSVSIVGGVIVLVIAITAASAILNAAGNALDDYKSNIDTSDYDWSWLED